MAVVDGAARDVDAGVRRHRAGPAAFTVTSI